MFESVEEGVAQTVRENAGLYEVQPAKTRLK
jgi:hypothetical protein